MRHKVLKAMLLLPFAAIQVLTGFVNAQTIPIEPRGPSLIFNNEIIVKLRPAQGSTQPRDVTDQDISRWRQAARIPPNTESVWLVTNARESASGAALIGGVFKAELEALLQAMRADPIVEFAEPNLLLSTQSVPTDPLYSTQWGFFRPTTAFGGANFEHAWTFTLGSPNVVVAVIDTGIRPHVDLRENLLPGADLISNLEVAADGNGRDADASDPGDYNLDPNQRRDSSWHGTHVAGIIASRFNNGLFGAGGAPGVRLLPVRALGRGGVGSLYDIADAIRWSVGIPIPGLPPNQNAAAVINMSLGGLSIDPVTYRPFCPRLFAEALSTAIARGAAVVVAAGNATPPNQYENSEWFAPANCPGVIVVANHDRAGFPGFGTNVGRNVSISAPGTAIFSTLNSGRTTPGFDSFGPASGTSMAAPHVAAALALAKSVRPTLSPEDLWRLLLTTARPGACASLGPGLCGAGYLDAGAMVAAAARLNTPPTPPPPPPTSSDSGGGGCFIATAAYGSEWHKHVVRLREWRDDVLLRSDLGKLFVRWYYKVSPPIAKYIDGSEILKAFVRTVLLPIVVLVDWWKEALVGLIALLGGLAAYHRNRVLRLVP